ARSGGRCPQDRDHKPRRDRVAHHRNSPGRGVRGTAGQRTSEPETGRWSTAASASPSTVTRIRGFFDGRLSLAGLALVVIVLGAFFQARNPIFLSFNNVVDLLRAGSLSFVVACA